MKQYEGSDGYLRAIGQLAIGMIVGGLLAFACVGCGSPLAPTPAPQPSRVVSPDPNPNAIHRAIRPICNYVPASFCDIH